MSIFNEKMRENLKILGIKIEQEKNKTTIKFYDDDSIKITKHSVSIVNYCLDEEVFFCTSYSVKNFLKEDFNLEISESKTYLEVYLKDEGVSMFDFELKNEIKEKKEHKTLELFSDLFDFIREEIYRFQYNNQEGKLKVDFD